MSGTQGRIALAVPSMVVALVLSGYAWVQERVATVNPAVPAVDVYALVADDAPIAVTVAAGGLFAPWTATSDELRRNVFLWRRMHLSDWNSVPNDLRAEAFDNMLYTYRVVLTAPAAWDAMTVRDWDRVPQPIRTVAYRHMVAYWAGFYAVGESHALPAGVVSDTLAAIVMSESWFEHRATGVNRAGNHDLGLAQASDYARGRIRELYRRGLVDVDLVDEDYFDPWHATRFLAVWMSLLLDEAAGDLDLAVRAYHRGIIQAPDGAGTAYLEAVHRRRQQFIRNLDAPPAWGDLWLRGRAIEQQAWPWVATGGAK